MDLKENTDDVKFQDYLFNLSLPEKFLIWLYSPIISLSIKDIQKIKAKYNVPANVIILKLFAHYIYEVSNAKTELTDDEIFQSVLEKLIVNDLVKNYDPHSFRSIYDRCKNIKLKVVNKNTVKTIVNLLPYFNTLWFGDHKGYPLPHPKLGRPHIGHCICLFEDCNYEFQSGDDLLDHLEQLGKHTKNFHKFHELEVANQNLTPEKIKADGITRCPALICDKAKHIFTPDELIYHFTLLGIPPFWSLGQSVSNLYGNGLFNDDIFKCIYTTDECSVCLDRESEVLFLPCFHNVTCLDCVKHIKNKKCPLCCTPFKTLLPF
jgi:hypothetical protein